MTTQHVEVNLSEPLTFLGATVLSFNSSLGLSSQTSTLTVQLIEDCEKETPDVFLPNSTEESERVLVGDPVFFNAGEFSFGGILSSWNVKLGTSGRVYEARVEDPRQLLQNVSVVVDSYNGAPVKAANYVNIYHKLESPLCEGFGLSFNTEQGTPYLNIMDGLIKVQAQNGPFICSPTCTNAGRNFLVDFTTFPGGANSGFTNFPTYYRLQGPSIPLLEILTQASDVAGFEFYVYLEQVEGVAYPVIKVGLIDLRNVPASFGQVNDFVNSFVGGASELSYGQELRNEVTKSMMIGEKVHYLTETKSFFPFFGEEIQNGILTRVVPYGWDNFGFWITKSTESLNKILDVPLPLSVYSISELDIRLAMSSFKSWLYWVFIMGASGGLNTAIRSQFSLTTPATYPTLIAALAGSPAGISTFGYWVDALSGQSNASRLAADTANAPTRASRDANKPEILQELEKIHKWLSDLGNEYYGRKYLCALNEGICSYLTEYTFFDPDADGNPEFSSNPTTAGWVDPGIPVLQLQDPYLQVFRDDTGKIGGFAAFNTDGRFADGTTSGSDTNGNFGIPTPGGPGGGQGVPGFDGLAGLCWVAREVYGEDNIKWLVFRDWIIRKSPRLVYNTYKKYGPKFAQFIKDKNTIKNVLRYFMDKIVDKHLRSKC